MSKIIAFGYKKRAGKDTSAKFLDSFLRVSRPGLKVKKVSFASKLKDISFQLYGWAGLQPGIYYETEAGQKVKEVVLPRIGLSPRDIWIGVGNALRSVYKDTWIDHALQGNSGSDIVIVTDLRFSNEAMKIKEQQGLICKIIRDSVPQGTDPAEVELDSWSHWDFIIINDGNLQDLHSKIETVGKQVLS